MRSRPLKKHMEALCELREKLAEALNDVLERHGVLHGGVAYVPFDKAAAALFPDSLKSTEKCLRSTKPAVRSRR
jgi:hypothetical protein